MDRPLVSILVPIYNVEDYIEECISSIKKQSYTNFEVICINDGSNDSSIDRYLNAVCDDKRFKLYTQENKGLANARNVSLSKAQGELITFLDSDDYIYPLYLETLVNGLILNDADISICGHNMAYPSHNFPIHFKNDKLFSSKKALAYMTSDTIILNYCWGKCFKRHLWDGISFPESRIYEDVLTVYKTFLKANKIFISSSILYNYNIRNGSISQKKAKGRNTLLKQAYKEQMQTIVKYYPSFKPFLYYNLIKTDYLFYQEMILYYLSNK